MITNFKLFEISNDDFQLSDSAIRKLKANIFDNADDEHEIKDYIKYGGDVNKTEAGITLLMFISQLRGPINRVQLLINAGADWNITDTNDYTFMDYLPHSVSREIVKLYPEKYKDFLEMQKIKKNTDKYKI